MAVAGCQHCFTAPGLGLNSIAWLGQDMWKTAPTSNIAVFRSGVMSVTLGIPDINEGPSLSATFDGSSVIPSNWGSWSSIDIGSVAAIISGLFHGSGLGLLVALVIKCTVGRAIMLLVFGANDKHEEWEPNWGARGLSVWHGEGQRSTDQGHWAACWCRRSCRLMGHENSQVLEWCCWQKLPPSVAWQWPVLHTWA